MQRINEHPVVDLSDSFTLAGRQESKRKILLLEDDVQFREIMREFLNSHGFQVVAVENGVEGVHEVLASDFEVILCDMMMPTLPA